MAKFPFLFGGAFIEGEFAERALGRTLHFPSFSEGLSLRVSPSRIGRCW